MVMKDKLVKFHHKGMYYRFRKIGICFLAAVSLGTIVAVPTYITLREITAQAQKAEAEEPELLEEDSVDLSSY